MTPVDHCNRTSLLCAAEIMKFPASHVTIRACLDHVALGLDLALLRKKSLLIPSSIMSHSGNGSLTPMPISRATSIDEQGPKSPLNSRSARMQSRARHLRGNLVGVPFIRRTVLIELHGVFVDGYQKMAECRGLAPLARRHALVSTEARPACPVGIPNWSAWQDSHLQALRFELYASAIRCYTRVAPRPDLHRHCAAF